MNNREAMQKAFEAWASDYSDEFDFSTTPHGTYIDHPTYCAFIGFRAALASQAQQTESKVLDLIVKHGICVEFTHDQMAVTAFWCGNPDINFTEIASGDLASATRNCVIKVVESLPPAPEGGDK